MSRTLLLNVKVVNQIVIDLVLNLVKNGLIKGRQEWTFVIPIAD